jgi:protein-S-isoprenylcysteine O-methyltransferase Ste14
VTTQRALGRQQVWAVVPSVLIVVGLTVFGGLWLAKIWHFGASEAGLLTLTGGLVYVAWVLGEARISARELTATSETYDHGTTELAALAKQLLLMAALIPVTQPDWITGSIGIAMIALGGGLRIVSVRELAGQYTHRIRIPAGPLTTSGPYRLVRHPAYLGTLIGHAGIAVLFLNGWALAALLGAWLPVVVARTWLEDRLLRQRVPGYEHYCARTHWRLIPGVW